MLCEAYFAVLGGIGGKPKRLSIRQVESRSRPWPGLISTRAISTPGGEAAFEPRSAEWVERVSRDFLPLDRAPAGASLAFPPNRLGSAGFAGGAFLLRGLASEHAWCKLKCPW